MCQPIGRKRMAVYHDRPYIELIEDVIKNGVDKTDRTGTGTRSVFARQMRFDLSKGFPLLTSKKVFWKGVQEELFWFLRGDTNANNLSAVGVKIWEEWKDPETGDLGPVYGRMWRKWPTDNYGPPIDLFDEDGDLISTVSERKYVDQIQQLVLDLITNPDSRRLLVSAWNPAYLPDPSIKPHKNPARGKQALPPCHYSFQCYVSPDRKLSLMVNQRSCDVGLGVPFNIASYALLCHMLASMAGLGVGELIWSGGDVHIYSNHIEALQQQVDRWKKEGERPSPTLRVKLRKQMYTDISEFTAEDFVLEGYDPYPAIKMDIAV